MKATFRLMAVSLGLGVFLAPGALAQSGARPAHPLAANVIVPQARAFNTNSDQAVEITEINVGVVIVEQVATTTMDISLHNPAPRPTDAELVVPVSEGAVLRGFTFEGGAAEPTATLLPKDEARRIYEQIVAKIRDPALLEFVNENLIRSSVFPVAAGGTQKVRLTYEHLLPRDGGRVDYVLPRSESLDCRMPWNVAVKIKSKTPISTVYSPSHEVQTARSGPGVLSVRIADNAVTRPGPFRMSYLLEQNGVSASLLAYPDAKTGGGYFLLLAGLPAELANPDADTPIRREVTLVIDRSGSMRGEKFEQAREAARQVLAGLKDGETFNIIAYNDTVTRFSVSALVKGDASVKGAYAFLNAIGAGGGTNIHDALLESLRPAPAENTLGIVLFLTDGLPTVGNTSEVAIRDVAMKHNFYQRRIFTFGVGADVNTPLLEKIATETRARATFVLPGADVEVAVSNVFSGLQGPILAGVSLEEVSPTAYLRAVDMMPAKLPDLFAGDQLVVLGRYAGERPLEFQLRGDYLGQQRTFRFTFPLDGASTRNAFVPRLWASRRIAVLVDAIRDMGADAGPHTAHAPANPRLAELTDEIVRLSTEFGVLTEYTAFLAREGTDLSQRDAVLAQARDNFQRRAIATRSGLSSFNQSMNSTAQRAQMVLNGDNSYYDENMNRVAIAEVQQINDRAFFRRGQRWIDSRVVADDPEPQVQREVAFGSYEFYRLVGRLAAEGRQGCMALQGEILLRVDGELVLVKSPDGK